MHIGMIIDTLAGNGAEAVFLTLADAFVFRGHEVSILLLKLEGERVADVPDKCFISYPDDIARINNNALQSMRNRKLRMQPVNIDECLCCNTFVQHLHLYPAYNKLHIYEGSIVSAWIINNAYKHMDIMLSFLDRSNIATIIGREMSAQNIPVVLSQHNNAKFSMNFWMKRRAKFFFPQADAIVGVSNGVTETIRDIISLKVGSVITKTIFNPINFSRIDTMKKQVPSHPWLRDKRVPVIINVSRLARVKNHVTLLKAFAILRSRRKLRLILIGKASSRIERKYKQIAKQLGIHEDVSFTGWLANPYAMMYNADVLVLSSLYEGLPTVILESFACGCNVVSTDCDYGPAEILCDGQYGHLVPVKDYKKLAESTELMLDNPMDLDVLRARAKIFSVERCVKSYLKLFENILYRESSQC